jgi:UDP-N-acetylmuramoyl-tripeptide--D-alanyl-D-alanine ligase
LKKTARNFVLKILNSLARRRISASSTIIGITGSVGKTTAKDAATRILESQFTVLANAKSFNSEFGVPLTLLGEKSGFANPISWLAILFRAFFKSFSKIVAEKIVLELGVDAPGDFDRLLAVVRPKIGVFLNVAPVHIAPGQFENLSAIAAEKSKLIENLPTDGVAILNADDEFSRETKTAARKIFFGFAENADLRASEISENLDGISARIFWQNEKAELKIPIIGQQNLPSILAALAVGLASGIELKKAISALADFRLPPGRLNLLAGIRGSKILDGTYNSNPKSLAAGLATFARLPAARRIFVGGQMNELGADSARLHRELAAQIVADLVVGVHGDARIFTEVAGGKFFDTAEEAGEFLKNEIRAGDLIFLKGSQNKVRLEKIVAAILAKPDDRKLLCRQEREWQKI